MAQIVQEGDEQQPKVLTDAELVDDLSEQHLTELREAFELFDKDNSKSISKEELKHVFKAMGQEYSDAELTKMVAGADKDGNAEISFFEFCVLMAKNVKQPEKRDEYAEAFKVFDRMSNGSVDSIELIQAMTNVGAQKLEDLTEASAQAEQDQRTREIIQILE